MRYVLPAEGIEINRRLHWSVVVPSFLAALAALFAAGYITGQLTDRTGPIDEIIWLLALAVMGRSIWRFVAWNHDRFIVTSRRIMVVSGVFNRRVAMMPLMRVTDMTYERSLLGRIFGWGTFVIESAGQDQALSRIDRLPSPDWLYQTVCRLMFGAEQRLATALPDEIAAEPQPGAEAEPSLEPDLELNPDPNRELI